LLAILGAVLLLLFIIYYSCSLSCKKEDFAKQSPLTPLVKPPLERAAIVGANQTFPSVCYNPTDPHSNPNSPFTLSCENYLNICGSDSTFAVISNLSSTCNSDSSCASQMDSMVSKISREGCCDPDTPTALNCRPNIF